MKQDVRQDNNSKEPKEFDEKVISISRVSKKTKGGNKMGFSILMVVGDRKGRVGVGLGKSKDVQSAIRKGVKKAKKKMITVPLNGTTIPFSIVAKHGAGQVMLKPAPKGSGVIAGGPVRAVVEAAGIRDVSSKILGSSNQSVSVYATFEALNQIRQLVEVKGIKLKSIADTEREEAAKLRQINEKAAAKTDKSVKIVKPVVAVPTKKAIAKPVHPKDAKAGAAKKPAEVKPAQAKPTEPKKPVAAKKA